MKNFECVAAICPFRQAPRHLKGLLSLRAGQHLLLTPREVRGWGRHRADKADPKAQCPSRQAHCHPGGGPSRTCH